MLKIVLLSALLSGVLILLPGCSTLEPASRSAGGFDPASALSAQGDAAKLVSGNSIELSVEVDGRMEVTLHRAAINEAGFVTLPLVGDVRIGGLYLGGARHLIGKAYGRYFVNPPVIMISLADEPGTADWGYVTITGRVITPGRVKITTPGGMKLTSVIQASGGFAGSAKKNDIRITRIDNAGRKVRTSVDYDAIGQDGNIDADVDLKDGDIVYVPERIF